MTPPARIVRISMTRSQSLFSAGVILDGRSRCRASTNRRSSCRNAFHSDRHGRSIALAHCFRTARATSVPQVRAFAFRSFQARQLSLKASLQNARATCPRSSLEMRRLHGLWTSFRAESSNAHKATLAATSASREVPASRCTEAQPARMQASRLAALLFGTRVDRTNGGIECRVRRCSYKDSYALRPHQRAASGRSKPSAVPRV